ncbi:MAG: cytochrome c biogenesis protein CcdA [Syntrophales bacterium]|nr:cytochrome c biogenesis protein CcdA [Syntrophales bacterium]
MIENLIEALPLYLQGSFALAFLAVYLGGVLVSFTPCVYPVIPITVAYVGAHGSGSKLRGFVLSIAYVLGMALVYTALGGIAALSGRLFGHVQTNPWTYFFIANICILMGLSMLDVFVLPLRTPAFLNKVQPREKPKGIMGSFLVGAASGLVMSPCITPVLAALLSYIATRQNVILGMGFLFVFAFGMGTLLIVLGTFAALIAGIPKSGEWMVRISHISGWILIAMGEFFLIKAGTLWL